MDLLSRLLREMRLESAAFRRIPLRAPFRVAFEQQSLRGVHVVVHGRCELELAGQPTRVLESGDLVLTPRADPHFLRSVGNARGRSVSSNDLFCGGAHLQTRDEDAAAGTTIVCGAFLFHEVDHPALAGLPRMVHVAGEGGRPAPWLRPYVDVLLAEASEAGAGGDVVMARLSDALVARTLRHHVEQGDETGWLLGLRDARIARTLAAVHDRPHRPWTVAQLARLSGMSRTAFAARFVETVGEPPIKYVLRCRMRLATTLLRRDEASLAEAASQVGYGSEAAFSAAFKRWFKVSPGAYRRAAR